MKNDRYLYRAIGCTDSLSMYPAFAFQTEKLEQGTYDSYGFI